MSDVSISSNLDEEESEQALQHINHKVKLLKTASLFGAYGAEVISLIILLMSATHMLTGNYVPSDFSKHQVHILDFATWCYWDLILLLFSILSIPTTLFLIWGLKKDKILFLYIWMIVFTILVVIDVMAEILAIIIHGIELEIRHGRFVFFVTVDSYIYLQLILFSYYRSLTKEREQLLNEMRQVSRATMIRVNERLRASVDRTGMET